MLNEALRLIRVFHDLSQKDLAAKFHISNSYMSEIESGVKEPTLELLQKYSRIFEIPMSSILFFSESINNPDATRDKTRRYVSKKILSLLDFIALRSGRAHAK
jgi:transcriptional regulator with XRE-family HTH domain